MVRSIFNSVLLYDVVLTMSLFTVVRGYSSFSFYHSSFMWLMMVITMLLSVLLFIVSLSKYRKTDYIILFLLALLVLIVGLNSEWIISLWLSYVLIVGAKDIPFKNIVKVHFFSMAFFCLSNMLSYDLGWTDNVLFNERENVFGGVTERNSYGYLASTDYANHVIFILLDYWILKDGKLKFFELLVFISVASFIYINCGARLATLCVLLMVFFSPVVGCMENQKNRFCIIGKKSFVYAIPFCAFISLYSTYIYDANNVEWLIVDTFFSGRFGWAHDSLMKYGIPLLGQSIDMYGTGNAGIGSASYDYVDSSYVQFYMRWGLILTTLLLYILFIIGRKAMKCNHVVMLFSLMLAGASGMICQFLFHIGYCVLPLLLCAKYPTNNLMNASNKNR